MEKTGRPRQVAVFGAFCFDLESGQLKKKGVRLRLEDKPAQVLRVLVEHRGELVSREALQKVLWPNGVHLDFEHGLNKSINKLRDALGDDADVPKYIETLHKRGYRFVGHLEFLLTHTDGSTSQSDNLSKKDGTDPGERNRLPLSMPFLRQSAIGIGIVLVLLIATAYVVWKLPGEGPASTFVKRLRVVGGAKPSLAFEERDWVLISSFENKTGNPVLDGTLEYALERELSNSQFVNVVPRERINGALRLMRESLHAKIDAVVGREICLRDGGIRAMLTGRVERFGTVYVLSVQVVDPARDVAVASLSEEDAADSQMASAVRRLSNRVRETLGEKRSLIQQSDRRLERVTKVRSD